jgi:DNA polymerase-1
LIQKLEWLGFQSLIGKLIPLGDNFTEAKSSSFKKDFIQIDTRESLCEIADKLTEIGSMALLVGDSLTISSNGLPIYRIVLQINDVFEVLKPLLVNERIDKITFDAKALMHTCKENGIDIKGIKFDTLIAAYLLNPAQSKYDLKQLVYDYLKLETENPDAEDVRLLADCLRDKLKEQDMLNLYTDIEHPLIELLFCMENVGFRADREMLENLGIEFSLAIDRLTNEIFQFASGEFNINSTKQLGEILFDKLKLPAVKKTKTGYSTDIEVLEELKGRHPIIGAIIDYRQIAKLKSTYIDGLVKMIDPDDGRIHSSFNQTVAVTGRISSTEPNLQNIPVRVAIGRRIRKIFIPSEAHVLVDADYSQIELRILAHMSNDQDFIESFLSGEDIHRKTASEMFGISIDEVTSEQRNSAKAVNFGIVYGISDFGLSQNLGISVGAAKGYIDRYFNRYPKVRQYLDGLVELAERQGYVTTLMGRRRHIPEIRSRNKTVHSLGKRLAMNTPIQGTAADIIKKAMLDVYNELKARNLRSKLILQVHDELIIDTHKDEIDEVKELLLDKMANTVKLAVPLSVEVGVGDNWYDAK